MSYVRITLSILVLSGIIVSCDPPVQENYEQDPDTVENEFLKVNKYLRDRHQDHIEAFVSRVGWEMDVSSTGLWYLIDSSGSGEKALKNSRVTYAFSSLLLDGTPCYEATESNPRTITLGKGGIESGLEEGLLKMMTGDSAIFIIPPHLGHGNFGDRNKIPGNSVIIFKVRLLNVS